MKSRAIAPRVAENPRTSFRRRLSAELARRCSANPKYSLRSFAADLEIDHSTLSQLLRGRRALQAATIRRLAAALGIADAEIEEYVRNQALIDASARPDAEEESVRRLASDVEQALSEWYHFAILELVHVDGFRADLRWVARVLGIEVVEAQRALDVLLRLGLLRMEAPDRWTDLTGDAVADLGGFRDAAVARLRADLQRIAGRGEGDPRLADYSNATFAIDEKRVPELIRRIAAFRRDLFEWLAGGGAHDEVYQLEIALFPLTRTDPETEPRKNP